MNKGIKFSSGKYIDFNSGDVITKNSIKNIN